MSEYNINDYQTLHNYVLGYQHGNFNMSNNIIEAFRNFLLSYLKLIMYGTYNLKDYSLRKFIGLYIKNELINGNDKYNFREQLDETSKKIQFMFSKYTENEIKNELIATLLLMAKKYKDYDRPSFHNYVDKCFHYEAYRSLNLLIKDPISRCSNDEYIDAIGINNEHNELFENSVICTDYQLSLKNTLPNNISKSISPFDMESLDINWISGVTCNEIFNCLTPFERTIIKEHYICKKTDEEIAKEYGLCRATINRKRLKARKKLELQLNINF